MTKNYIKAALIMIKSLQDAMNQIESDVTAKNPKIGPVINRAKISGIDKALSLLDGFNIEDGEPVAECKIKISQCLPYIDLEISLDDDAKLVAYTGTSDDNTRQAGIMYYTPDKSPLDLALAEVKKGELAKIHGYDPDNKDIDLMIWTNPASEDYTEKVRIEHDQIDQYMN